MDPGSYEEGLRKIKERYYNSSPEKIALLKRLALEMQKNPNRSTFSAFHSAVHKLLGSSALYDLNRLSELCLLMDEEILRQIGENKKSGQWVFNLEQMEKFLIEVEAAFQCPSKNLEG